LIGKWIFELLSKTQIFFPLKTYLKPYHIEIEGENYVLK